MVLDTCSFKKGIKYFSNNWFFRIWMKAFQEVIDMPMESDPDNLMDVFFFLLGRKIDIKYQTKDLIQASS